MKRVITLFMFGAIWITSLWFAADLRAEPMIVIGDSLSATHHSWANQIRDNGTRIKLLAQNGRAIVEYDIPRDLHADGNYKSVIYLLGGNDALKDYKLSLVKEHFRAHMLSLKQKGFKVLVVVPPVFPFQREASEGVRSVLFQQCRVMTLDCIDMQEIFQGVPTYDTVHPTPEGHTMVMDFILASL